MRPGGACAGDVLPVRQGRTTLPARLRGDEAGSMTATTLSENGSGPTTVLPAGAASTAMPVIRGTGDRARTIGVVLVDPGGARWQRTTDVERLVTVATVTAGLVAAV